MSLRTSKIIYLFLKTTSLSRHRFFFESVLGLRLIEMERRLPHYHHGVVKYDAGDTILSLDLAAPRQFDPHSSDGLVTAFMTDRAPEICAALAANGYPAPHTLESIFPDEDNHHYQLHAVAPSTSEQDVPKSSPCIHELHLSVQDLAHSVEFYGDVLGLNLLDERGNQATFATGNINLVLHDQGHSDIPVASRQNGYLIVFHTPDITESFSDLCHRGLQFKGKVAFSDIGGTARFVDPSSNNFCLYQPSVECLTWDSGPKVLEIIRGRP